MPPLTSKQVRHLLSMPLVARLATVKPDGSPYVVPIWQYWDGQTIYLIPRAKSKFVEYLKNDPRVAISCADDINEKNGRVLIEGNAKILKGPEPMKGLTLQIAKEMAERYKGDSGLQYLQETMDMPRYLIGVKPNKMVTWTGKWHSRYSRVDTQ